MGHNVWIISAGDHCDHCDHCDQDYSPGLAWTRPGPRSPLPRAVSQGASYHVTCQSVSSGDGWRERAGGVVWDWMMTCWQFTMRLFGWSKCAWSAEQGRDGLLSIWLFGVTLMMGRGQFITPAPCYYHPVTTDWVLVKFQYCHKTLIIQL